MGKFIFAAVVVLLASGCSSKDDAPSCDLAHRVGTYVQHTTERAGGTCGILADQVVRVDNPGGLPPGCTKDAADSASGDRCEYDRSYTCETTNPAGAVSIVATTTEHDGGAKLTGVLSMTIRDDTGAFVCSSAYDVVFTRQ
jgi:hypothetical protein